MFRFIGISVLALVATITAVSIAFSPPSPERYPGTVAWLVAIAETALVRSFNVGLVTLFVLVASDASFRRTDVGGDEELVLDVGTPGTLRFVRSFLIVWTAAVAILGFGGAVAYSITHPDVLYPESPQTGTARSSARRPWSTSFAGRERPGPGVQEGGRRLQTSRGRGLGPDHEGPRSAGPMRLLP